MNIDASCHADGSRAVGAVLRNHQGEVVAGMACPIGHVLDATVAETLALLYVLCFFSKLVDLQW
jgi:DNA-binding IclR family transcriptional regulator